MECLCIFLLIQKIYTNIIVIKLKHGKEMYRTSDHSFLTSILPDSPEVKTLHHVLTRTSLSLPATVKMKNKHLWLTPKVISKKSAPF